MYKHAKTRYMIVFYEVLDDLLSEYEMSSHGPEKWQKLATFLHRSLEGQIADLSKKQLDQVIAEKNALSLQYRSIQDRMELLHKQLEASTKSKSEYLRRYEDAINDKKQIADDYTRRLTTLQNQCSSLDERCSSSLKSLESAKREVVEWRRKYEQISSKQKAEEDHTNSELINLRSRIAATETWVSAAREQVQSAEEEAAEWKRKFDFAARETKAALEKAATAQEHINKQAQLREDVRRAEFSATLAAKEEEIKDKVAKADKVEQHLAALISELKASESKLKNCDFELSAQKLEIKELSDKFDAAKATSQSFEREVKILEQEKIHLEQKYSSEFKRFEEIQERCSIAENKANRATELADKARADAVTAQKEKTDVQRVAMERLTQIERSQRHIENLERVKVDLEQEVERVHTSELDALSKVSLLESRVEEREKEIESLLESSNAERVSNVKVLESLLENERKAREEANLRAEEMSVQLQSSQGKLDLLQQELITVRLNESALSSKLKTSSRGKRSRLDDSYDMGVGSVEVDEDVNTGRKRSKSTTSPLKFTQTGVSEDDDKQSQQTESGDHTKFTIVKLRQEITKNGFGAELLQLKNPNKKDILSLYEKYVLTKKSI
ncbi:hypothetical protein GIB67_031067 [Kingdonia uniflora]|uniref:Uncharacterized protein n=1 Tax=Kingdonia uniflora TaxID=39325 RepID=A0A7J7LML3_9MAGN|nr:hypothetical protein GIB67_031067 [Kingdonia uniflora]